MKLVWIILVGFLTLMLSYSATNSAVIITEVEMSISSGSQTVVDPGIILHISDHLTPAECCRLVTFLGDNTENPEYSTQMMKKLAGPNLSSCRCQEALKWWNENFLKDSFDELGKEKLGEDLLVYGMKHLGFTEMEKFLNDLERQKIHNEVTKLKHELDEHKKEGQAAEEIKSIKSMADADMTNTKSSVKNIKQEKKRNNDSLFPMNEDATDHNHNKIILIGLMIVSTSIMVILMSLFTVRYVVSRKRKDQYVVMMFDKDEIDQEEETEWML